MRKKLDISCRKKELHEKEIRYLMQLLNAAQTCYFATTSCFDTIPGSPTYSKLGRVLPVG
jgi:hypothetical protein